VVVVPENDEGEVPSWTYRPLPGESAVVGAEELQTVDDRMRQSALQRSSVTVPHVLHCKYVSKQVSLLNRLASYTAEYTNKMSLKKHNHTNSQ